MEMAVTIVHIIIAVALVVVVLFQQGKDAGLSGAFGGDSSESFYGKNKGRTIDAALKKVTAVVAFLFIISSIVLATYSISANNKSYPNDSAVKFSISSFDKIRFFSWSLIPTSSINRTNANTSPVSKLLMPFSS